MNSFTSLKQGAVIKKRDFKWRDEGQFKICHPISPEKGSENITGVVVEILPGGLWECCEMAAQQEVIVVVYSGHGEAIIGEETVRVERTSTLYAPKGIAYSIQADEEESMIIYIWQSNLPEGSKVSASPRLVNSLFNNETVFKGYQGNNSTIINNNPANMNFLFWPGTGCSHLSLHCGIQEPGQSFGVHQHPISEELFIGFEGKGQVHLDGEWVSFEEGDILYAPPKMFHGTRNPFIGSDAKRFVTCGGPVPFDVNFYLLAGVSSEVK
jgi:quercetin dioxygenase-like cupin family protein